jgi:hypothetical protein
LRHSARSKKFDDGSVFIRRHQWCPANFSLRRLFILFVFVIFHVSISLLNAIFRLGYRPFGILSFDTDGDHSAAPQRRIIRNDQGSRRDDGQNGDDCIEYEEVTRSFDRHPLSLAPTHDPGPSTPSLRWRRSGAGLP